MTIPTYTANDLATRLRVSKEWVYGRARRREIPCLKVGRFYRFTAEHVAAIEAQLEQAANPTGPMYGLSPRSRHRHRTTP